MLFFIVLTWFSLGMEVYGPENSFHWHEKIAGLFWVKTLIFSHVNYNPYLTLTRFVWSYIPEDELFCVQGPVGQDSSVFVFFLSFVLRRVSCLYLFFFYFWKCFIQKELKCLVKRNYYKIRSHFPSSPTTRFYSSWPTLFKSFVSLGSRGGGGVVLWPSNKRILVFCHQETCPLGPVSTILVYDTTFVLESTYVYVPTTYVTMGAGVSKKGTNQGSYYRRSGSKSSVLCPSEETP